MTRVDPAGDLSAVILAGGQSRRMGRDKAWIECGGRSLIALAMDTVRQLGVREVFISGRSEVDYSMFKCPVLCDLEPGLGPMGGVERGLHCCRAPLLLVLAVDLPRMTASLLGMLAGRCDTRTGVVPQHGGQLEPLAAIYPKRCHTFAFDCVLRGSGAVRQFDADCLRERAVRIWRVPASAASGFDNWNTPNDVSKAEPHGTHPVLAEGVLRVHHLRQRAACEYSSSAT